MLQRKEFVEQGDWVVVNDASNVPRLVQAVEGQSFSCKEGNFYQSDLIGKRYGGKLHNITNTNYVFIIAPTAYLWPTLVDFRTQILYQQDISLIQYFLDLKPGSVIIESGTGSGVLTTSLARSVAPHGHVHTFEFHPERVTKAKNDFAMNKVDDVVTVRQRDILDRGFPFFPQGVDAAFLDLPAPHDVIPSVDRSLRPQGRICNFSPCIEQVQRVCLKLAELGYEEIFTVEILAKEYELLKVQLPQTLTYNQGVSLGGVIGHNGAMTNAQGNQYILGEQTFLNDRDKQTHQRNKERNAKLQEQKKQKAAAAAAATSSKTDDATTNPADNTTTQNTNPATNNTSENTNSTVDDAANTDQTTKKSKPNSDEANVNGGDQVIKLEHAPALLLPDMILNKLPKADLKANVYARPKITMRGHTGYLTFARKRSSTTPQDGVEYATPFTRSAFTAGQ